MCVCRLLSRVCMNVGACVCMCAYLYITCECVHTSVFSICVYIYVCLYVCVSVVCVCDSHDPHRTYNLVERKNTCKWSRVQLCSELPLVLTLRSHCLNFWRNCPKTGGALLLVRQEEEGWGSSNGEMRGHLWCTLGAQPILFSSILKPRKGSELAPLTEPAAF